MFLGISRFHTCISAVTYRNSTREQIIRAHSFQAFSPSLLTCFYFNSQIVASWFVCIPSHLWIHMTWVYHRSLKLKTLSTKICVLPLAEPWGRGNATSGLSSLYLRVAAFPFDHNFSNWSYPGQLHRRQKLRAEHLHKVTGLNSHSNSICSYFRGARAPQAKVTWALPLSPCQHTSTYTLSSAFLKPVPTQFL